MSCPNCYHCNTTFYQRYRYNPSTFCKGCYRADCPCKCDQDDPLDCTCPVTTRSSPRNAPTEGLLGAFGEMAEHQGPPRTEAIRHNVCTNCGGLALEFKDRASRREYGITGFCQSCQDEIFGV